MPELMLSQTSQNLRNHLWHPLMDTAIHAYEGFAICVIGIICG